MRANQPQENAISDRLARTHPLPHSPGKFLIHCLRQIGLSGTQIRQMPAEQQKRVSCTRKVLSVEGNVCQTKDCRAANGRKLTFLNVLLRRNASVGFQVWPLFPRIAGVYICLTCTTG